MRPSAHKIDPVFFKLCLQEKVAAKPFLQINTHADFPYIDTKVELLWLKQGLGVPRVPPWTSWNPTPKVTTGAFPMKSLWKYLSATVCSASNKCDSSSEQVQNGPQLLGEALWRLDLSWTLCRGSGNKGERMEVILGWGTT